MRQRATGEHVEQPEDAALLAVEQLLQLVGVDPRHRDVRPDPVDDERQQQKQQAPFQVAVLSGLAERIGKAGRHAGFLVMSAKADHFLFDGALSAAGFFAAALSAAGFFAAALSAAGLFAAA